MADLSPAAQAVLDAYHMRADHEGPRCPEVCFIAEALRALEEQLAQDKPAPMSSDLEVAVLTERIRMLRKIVELNELYWPPRFIMAVNTSPGVRARANRDPGF
jgi:hypothetical protein